MNKWIYKFHSILICNSWLTHSIRNCSQSFSIGYPISFITVLRICFLFLFTFYLGSTYFLTPFENRLIHLIHLFKNINLHWTTPSIFSRLRQFSETVFISNVANFLRVGNQHYSHSYFKKKFCIFSCSIMFYFINHYINILFYCYLASWLFSR